MKQNQCTNLVIASVPMQVWQDTYRPEAAFMHGTIFPELNMPYIITGRQSMPGCDKPNSGKRSGNRGANCKEGCKW